jgi:two-component system phosphate regulon sensor histidine kinase PhoR
VKTLRLESIPGTAWAAGLVAAACALAALLANASAAVLVAAAAGACLWGWSEIRRRDFSPSAEAQTEFVSLAEFAPLLEALPDPALLIDHTNRIVGSNAAARKQMRFEARGQYLTSILRHPDLLEAAQSAVTEGATRAVEYATPTDANRFTRCYVAPVKWGGKHAAMLVFHDESARVSTERMRADFLANASHELRTPLASLTLLIETIAGPARDDVKERDRFLGMMQVQAERMRRLIDDLLSLSRIELDEHVPPSDRADLAGVAREVVDSMTAVAAERGVGLKLIAPSSPAYVVGERFQLAQIIQNLIDNAVKYSKSGDVVTIELAAAGERDDAAAQAGRRWEEAGRIALLTPAAPAGSAYTYVRVEDRGPGIARRFLPRLGERFFRVERELGDERGGTGLGLAIVKHIINRHRGGFLVESQPGLGSAFAVYIESAPDEVHTSVTKTP